jgi:hypothetical protein
MTENDDDVNEILDVNEKGSKIPCKYGMLYGRTDTCINLHKPWTNQELVEMVTSVIKQRPTEVEALRVSDAWCCYWINNIPMGKKGKLRFLTLKL